jgi:hypothetical protein
VEGKREREKKVCVCRPYKKTGIYQNSGLRGIGFLSIAPLDDETCQVYLTHGTFHSPVQPCLLHLFAQTNWCFPF